MKKKIEEKKVSKAAVEKTPTKVRRVRKAPPVISKEAGSLPKQASLAHLKIPHGAHKRKRILGRGSSSGHGKTSTRGSKGQTSRAGRHFYLGFEGGQSPLIRRMPKRGFVNRFKKEFQIVNLRDLASLKESAITLEVLEQKGLIKNKAMRVKILGDGEIKNPVTVSAHAFSKKAATQIQNAGGKIEIVNA